MAFNSAIEGVVKARVPVPASWNVNEAPPIDGMDAETTYGQMGPGGEMPKQQRTDAMEMKQAVVGKDGMTEIPMSPPNGQVNKRLYAVK